jgi:hypothetical protein
MGECAMSISYKLIGSSAAGLVLGGTVTYLSYAMGDDFKASSLNILIVVLGLALGWLLGILLSPYSDTEEKKFTEYAKAFGIFASGYLVGKIDKVIEALFQPDFILDSVHGFRVMSFIAALIISLVFTFVFRRYG